MLSLENLKVPTCFSSLWPTLLPLTIKFMDLHDGFMAKRQLDVARRGEEEEEEEMAWCWWFLAWQ